MTVLAGNPQTPIAPRPRSPFSFDVDTGLGPACVTVRRTDDGSWVGTVTSADVRNALIAARALGEAVEASDVMARVRRQRPALASDQPPA